MNIEVLLTEAEIAQEFAESMQARDLPEKFFYWLPLSVNTWLEFSRAGHEAWADVGGKLRAAIGDFAPPIAVISFGAGEGARDRAVLKSLALPRELKYFPVDASQALLELACCAAEDEDIETRGIKADISSPVHLLLASDAAESPKVFLMLGNTLGGFDPLDQIRHVAGCLHDSDRLLIDGQIQPAGNGGDTARAFALAPLFSVGLTEEDGDLLFSDKRDDRHDGLFLTTRHFRANRDVRIVLAGREIMLERGERILLNFRYQYTAEAFRWLLKDQARLKILDEAFSSDGRFLSAVCSR